MTCFVFSVSYKEEFSRRTFSFSLFLSVLSIIIEMREFSPERFCMPTQPSELNYPCKHQNKLYTKLHTGIFIGQLKSVPSSFPIAQLNRFQTSEPIQSASSHAIDI